MGAAGARTLAMLATVAPAAFVAGVRFGLLPLIISEASSAGGQNQRAIRCNGYGVLGVCTS